MKLETCHAFGRSAVAENWKFGLTALLLLFLTGCEKPTLPEGGFAAKAVLSENSLQIGDGITLTMTARHPAGSAVKFPTIGKSKEVVVRGRSIDTTERAEGILETEEVYQLTSLRLGNWMVTTNPVLCTFADGNEKAQALPELTLHVQSTLSEASANKLSDIKGLAKPPFRISPKVWVPLLVALLALIAGLLTLLFMKKPKAIFGSEPVIPPHITAHLALDALRGEKWMPEPFFVKLSLILRTYLEDRFDLNAPESTTEELAAKLNHDTRLTLKDQTTLREFFTQADLVKFARAGAEQDVMRTAFDTIETFVDQTQQEESQSEEIE